MDCTELEFFFLAQITGYEAVVGMFNTGDFTRFELVFAEVALNVSKTRNAVLIILQLPVRSLALGEANRGDLLVLDFQGSSQISFCCNS